MFLLSVAMLLSKRFGTRERHDADMIIAATLSDEVNMVTCQIAHSIFSIPRKIARIRSNFYLEENYSSYYRSDHLPIDEIISPERRLLKVY